MANPEHVKILKQGVEVWNKWRRDNLDIIPDLRGAGLNGKDLRDINFKEADLSGANLLGANLSGANIQCAYFNNADLRDADLSGVEMYISSLWGYDYVTPDFSGAKMVATRFSSRRRLEGLKYPLTTKQRENVIFEDELEKYEDENSIEDLEDLTDKEPAGNSKGSLKRRIKVAVETPETYSEIKFRSQDLVTIVTALTEYYERNDNKISDEERDIKNLLNEFLKKLEAFTDALENFPNDKNLDELEIKALELKHEQEMLDKKATHELLKPWNILSVSLAGTAILGLMGVPIANAAITAFGAKAVEQNLKGK